MAIPDTVPRPTRRRLPLRWRALGLLSLPALMLSLPAVAQTPRPELRLPRDYATERKKLQKIVRDGRLPPFNDPKTRRAPQLIARAKEETDPTRRLVFFSLAGAEAMSIGAVFRVSLIDFELDKLGLSGPDRWTVLEEAWRFRKRSQGWKLTKRQMFQSGKPQLESLDTGPMALFEFHLQRARAAQRAERPNDAKKSMLLAKQLIARERKARKDILMASWAHRQAELAAAFPQKLKPAAQTPVKLAAPGALFSVTRGTSVELPDLLRGVRDPDRTDEPWQPENDLLACRLDPAECEKRKLKGMAVTLVSAWFRPPQTGHYRFLWRMTAGGTAFVNGVWLGDYDLGKDYKGQVLLERGRYYLMQYANIKNSEGCSTRCWVERRVERAWEPVPLDIGMDAGQLERFDRSTRKHLRALAGRRK